MPPRDPNLPEGTDSIIEGAGDMTGGSGSGSAIGGGSSGMGSSSGMGGASGMGGSDFADTGSSGGAIGGGDAFGGTGGYTTGGGSGGTGANVQSLKTQATDKARDVATQGKERAAEALDSVSRMVSETADTVDERLGPQYGNYVRKAADALDGLNDSLRTKQVDELFDDARNLVRKSPAVAIGAAAAIGFLLVRLVRSGMPQTIDQDDDRDLYGNRVAGMTGLPPRVDNSYDPVA